MIYFSVAREEDIFSGKDAANLAAFPFFPLPPYQYIGGNRLEFLCCRIVRRISGELVRLCYHFGHGVRPAFRVNAVQDAPHNRRFVHIRRNTAGFAPYHARQHFNFRFVRYVRGGRRCQHGRLGRVRLVPLCLFKRRRWQRLILPAGAVGLHRNHRRNRRGEGAPDNRHGQKQERKGRTAARPVSAVHSLFIRHSNHTAHHISNRPLFPEIIDRRKFALLQAPLPA